MNAAMNIAVSGMLSASAGFTAGASNLVSLESDGPVSATSPQQQVAPTSGRVATLANGQGMLVQSDPARQVVNMMTASLAYRANIATFKTAQEMEKNLLDATARAEPAATDAVLMRSLDRSMCMSEKQEKSRWQEFADATGIDAKYADRQSRADKELRDAMTGPAGTVSIPADDTAMKNPNGEFQSTSTRKAAPPGRKA